MQTRGWSRSSFYRSVEDGAEWIASTSTRTTPRSASPTARWTGWRRRTNVWREPTSPIGARLLHKRRRQRGVHSSGTDQVGQPRCGVPLPVLPPFRKPDHRHHSNRGPPCTFAKLVIRHRRSPDLARLRRIRIRRTSRTPRRRTTLPPKTLRLERPTRWSSKLDPAGAGPRQKRASRSWKSAGGILDEMLLVWRRPNGDVRAATSQTKFAPGDRVICLE